MGDPLEQESLMPEHEGVIETRYLDLDGDGVPDAVETVEAIAATDDVGLHVVEVLEEIQADIGIDGVPQRVAVVDETTVELQPIDD